jgi:uncharacterized membrane protein
MKDQELSALQQSIQTIKKDFTALLMTFIALAVVFQIVFYKESFFVVSRTVLSFTWLFILPGYLILDYWRKEFDEISRLLIGAALGIFVSGAGSYYLGLMHINILSGAWIFPILSIIFYGWSVTRK